jgi:GDP-L-fucose synthase
VGHDVTIRELAEQIARTTGFDGELVFDATKPDGTPRKLMDVSRLTSAGWKARMDFAEGLARAYEAFKAAEAAAEPSAVQA